MTAANSVWEWASHDPKPEPPPQREKVINMGGLRCPVCGATDLRVAQTLKTPEGVILRSRRCIPKDHSFATVEEIVDWEHFLAADRAYQKSRRPKG